MISFILTFFISLSTLASKGVREVNLGLGMSTQIILEQEPKATLYADKKHFKISTNSFSKRSLAIIPFITSQELNAFRNSKGELLSQRDLAKALDSSFKTNLFVFFKNSNQLMFELNFVEKKKADHILKIKQIFSEDCAL